MRCVNLTVALKASHHDNLDCSSGLMLPITCFKRCDGLSLTACVVAGCMSPLLDSLAFDVAIFEDLDFERGLLLQALSSIHIQGILVILVLWTVDDMA
jgi:hypothetical protein